MDASIVIPTYNKLHFLQDTLKILESLDYPKDRFEVVVVDDGSTDGTSNILSSREFVFRLQLVCHQTNRGRAAARNSGVRRAVGRVVVFLDDDMRVVPMFLKAHLQKHREEHKLAVLGNVRRSPEVRPNALIRYLDSRGVRKVKPGKPIPFQYFITNNVSIERQLLLEVGLFNEKFRFFGGEDLELGYRLYQAGATFVFEPNALAYRFEYRDIPELCDAMMTYGQFSLPIILQAHPELQSLLKTGWLDPLSVCSQTIPSRLEQVFFRLALLPPWGYLSIQLARFLNRLWVPDLLFSYLIYFHYIKGYRAYRKRIRVQNVHREDW